MNNTEIIGIRRRMNAGYTVRISEVMGLLDALETAQKELSAQRVAFQNCMGTTNGVSTQMNARLQAIREYMQTDPDYGVYDGVLSRSELQLFFDEIARLTAERDAAFMEIKITHAALRQSRGVGPYDGCKCVFCEGAPAGAESEET